LRTYADRFHIGDGTTIGPLTIFPIWSESQQKIEFQIPAETNMAVKEVETPTVETLKVSNTSSQGLLIPEGTILDGGMQTRVATRDIFVPRGVSRRLDVRCVERGRWNGETEHAVDGRAPISVVAALRGIGVLAGESQEHVWNRVSRLERHYGSRSTNSLLDIMDDEGVNVRRGRERRDSGTHQKRIDPRFIFELSQFSQKPLPGQQGVMVGVAGHPLVLEIHGNPDAFAAQYSSILNAITLDANTVDFAPTSGRNARAFAEEILYTPINATRVSGNSQSFTGVGSLSDIRSIASVIGGAVPFHTAVINRKHELALAA
jgi:hypothetical protein